MLSNISETFTPRPGNGNPVIIQIIMVLAILGILAPAVLVLMTGRFLPAALIIASLFLLVSLFFPRLHFYSFLASMSIAYPVVVGPISLNPIDGAILLLIISAVLDYLLNVRYKILSTPFDAAFIFLIGATLLSAFFAYNPEHSLVPLFRIMVVYLAFRLSFKFGLEIGPDKVLKIFLLIVFLLSCMNILFFIKSGGTRRIFGMAGIPFRTLAMMAFPVALSFLIWSEKATKRWKYSIVCLVVGAAIIATQSRAPVAAEIFAVLGIWILLKYKSGISSRALKQMKKFLLPVGIAVVLFVIYKSSFFIAVLGRYVELIVSVEQPTGSVALRMTLWNAAVSAFTTYPLFGLGIGNFGIVGEIIPKIGQGPMWEYVKGMSAHNVVLHYLAETGIVGASALVYLAVKGIKQGRLIVKNSKSAIDNRVSYALFAGLLIFGTTIFFIEGWTFGLDSYILALFFGLCAAQHQKLINDNANKVKH